MYPVLVRENRLSDMISFQRIAMPFVWSYLTRSDTVVTFSEDEQVYFPYTNSQIYFVTPFNYPLFPIQSKKICTAFNPHELEAKDLVLYAGYLIGQNDRTVRSFIAQPDVMMIDTMNAIYFGLKHNDYRLVGSLLQVIQSLHELYATPISVQPETKSPTNLRIKPYGL